MRKSHCPEDDTPTARQVPGPETAIATISVTKPTSETQRVAEPVFSALPLRPIGEPPNPVATEVAPYPLPVRTNLKKRDDTAKVDGDSLLVHDLDKVDLAALGNLLLDATDLADHWIAGANLSLKFDVDGLYLQSHAFITARKNSHMSGQLTKSMWGSSELTIRKDDLDEDALLQALLGAVTVDVAPGLSSVALGLQFRVEATCSVGVGSAEPICADIHIKMSGGVVEPTTPSENKTANGPNATKAKRMVTVTKTITEDPSLTTSAKSANLIKITIITRTPTLSATEIPTPVSTSALGANTATESPVLV